MKNLKKILVAFAIVALLVSAVSVVIGAQDSEYTGSLEQLQKNYDAVATANLPALKSSALAKAYAYKEKVDPATEGYAELVAQMDATSVNIGNALFEAIGNVATSASKIDALNTVYSHFEACTPAEDTEGYAELLESMEAKNYELLVDIYETTMEPIDLDVKKENVLKLYSQFELRPLDTTVEENKAFIDNTSILAYNVAKELLDAHNAIPIKCVDENADGKCDFCGNGMVYLKECNHADINNDLKCDRCPEALAVVDICAHADEDTDGLCDVCALSMEEVANCTHIDDDNDMFKLCDLCGTTIALNNACPHTDDEDANGVCDLCGLEIVYASACVHTDMDDDTRCDVCHKTVDYFLICSHVDTDVDGVCDDCGIGVTIKTTCSHADAAGDVIDGICDKCGVVIEDAKNCVHLDVDANYKCDTCNSDFTYIIVCVIHVDSNNNNKCDNCDINVNASSLKLYCTHSDSDGDGICDNCTRNIKYVATCTNHVSAENSYKCDICSGVYSFGHYTQRYNSIKYLVNYISLADISQGDKPADGEESLRAQINAASRAMDKEIENNRIYLDEQADLKDFDITEYYIDDTFDKNPTFGGLKQAAVDAMWTAYNITDTYYPEEKVDANGNKYFNLHYGASDSISHLYIEPGFDSNFTKGLVFDFDFLIDENFKEITFETRQPSSGASKMYRMFIIAKGNDGRLYIRNYANRGIVEEVRLYEFIIPNIWTHMTITYNDETRLGALYINYSKVFDIEYSAEWDFNGLRIGAAKDKYNVGFDNFKIFQGTAYRDYDKFFGMEDEELFIYYVDYMLNETYSKLTRNTAYNEAKLLVPQLRDSDDEMIKAYVALFDACEYEKEIKAPAMTENIALLAEMVEELTYMKVTSDTVADINASIAKIEEFVSTNSELINKGDTSDGGYQYQMIKVNQVKQKLIAIENIIAFVEAIKKFDRATSLSALQRYYNAAEAVYKLAQYDLPENVEAIANDPIVVAFEISINGEEISSTHEDYIDLFEHYATFIERMDVRAEFENSRRIIDCIDFITELEGYEAAEEFWVANYDYIAKYMNIIRPIIQSNKYDATVEGVEAALVIYNELNSYFYKALQQEHIVAISEQLAKYVESDALIDKMGACAVVKEYLKNNDIALYNTTLSNKMRDHIAEELTELEELITTYQVYENVLALQQQDYIEILQHNTQTFVAIINHMDTVITYAELRPLFDLATTYYYSINVDDAEAQLATEKYAAYRDQLAKLEENGALFVGYVNAIEAAEELEGKEGQDALYQALSGCMLHIAKTDVNVEGVAEAKVIYDAALAEYNAELGAVNSEIAEANKISCASRTNSIGIAILAIIPKIFEN